jgi:hypothetical protein
MSVPQIPDSQGAREIPPSPNGKIEPAPAAPDSLSAQLLRQAAAFETMTQTGQLPPIEIYRDGGLPPIAEEAGQLRAEPLVEPNHVPSAHQAIKDFVPAVLGAQGNQELLDEISEQMTGQILEPLAGTQESAERAGIYAENMGTYMPTVQEDVKAMSVAVTDVLDPLRMTAFAAGASGLIMGYTTNRAIGRHVAEAARHLPADSPQLVQMQKIYAANQQQLNGSALDYVVSAALYAPSAIDFVIKKVGEYSRKVASFGVKSAAGFGMAISIAGTISAGIEWFKAGREHFRFKLGKKALENVGAAKPLRLEKAPVQMEPAGKKMKPHAMRIPEDRFESPVDQLLARRKAIFESKKAEFTTKFDQLIADYSDISEDQKKVFTYAGMIQRLLDQGVDVTEIEKALEGDAKVKFTAALALAKDHPKAFLETLKNDPALFDTMFRLAFDKRAGRAKLGVSIIKEMVAKKGKLERFFTRLRLNTAKINFSLAAVTTVLAIAAKVLLVTGVVVIPSIALSATGFGAIGVGVALMALGIWYLHRKKPNLFKTYLHFVQVRAILKRIPLYIRNFMLESKKANRAHTEQTIKEIESIQTKIKGFLHTQNVLNKNGKTAQWSDLDPELQAQVKKFRKETKELKTESEKILKALELATANLEEQVEKHNQDIEKIKAEIEEAQKNAEHWKDRVDQLQKEIQIANAKDHLRYISKKNPAFVHAMKPAEAQSTEKYDVTQYALQIADDLLFAPDMLEKEEIHYLQDLLQINITEFAAMPDKMEARKRLSEALIELFGADSSEFRKLNERILELGLSGPMEPRLEKA